MPPSRLPALRDKAAAAAAKLERLKAVAAEIDREEAQRRARREELIARRVQAGADLRHEGDIGNDASAATERLDAEEEKLRTETEAAGEQIAAATAAAENAAASSTHGRRNLPPRPGHLLPPRRSAPRASARCARRRRSSAGWRTSARLR